MAIVLDAITSTVNGNSGGTITFAHTNTGSNLILWVAIACNDSNQHANQTSGITYNTVAMTKLVEADSAADTRAELWYLINPATGNNNVVVTISSTINAVMLTALSYTGVKQIAPTIKTTTTGTASSVSNSITTVDDNSFCLDCISCESQPSVANTGSPTATSEKQLTNQSFQWSNVADKGAITPAGSVTMGYSNTSGNTWSYVQAAFSPFVSTAQIFPFMSSLGVGI